MRLTGERQSKHSAGYGAPFMRVDPSPYIQCRRARAEGHLINAMGC